MTLLMQRVSNRRIVLAGSGEVYRHYADKWHRLLAVPVKLPVPLAEFPMEVGS